MMRDILMAAVVTVALVVPTYLCSLLMQNLKELVDLVNRLANIVSAYQRMDQHDHRGAAMLLQHDRMTRRPTPNMDQAIEKARAEAEAEEAADAMLEEARRTYQHPGNLA